MFNVKKIPAGAFVPLCPAGFVPLRPGGLYRTQAWPAQTRNRHMSWADRRRPGTKVLGQTPVRRRTFVPLVPFL